MFTPDSQSSNIILWPALISSFTVIIDNKNYTSNVDKENIYFEGIDLDIADDLNEIIVHVDEHGLVEKFEFKLDSYCKAKGICVMGMNVTLKYEEFGEIGEIASPLE